MGNNFYRICLGAILLIFIFQVGTTFFVHPVYIWDEAVYANNALEMSHSHNFFVLTLDGEPNLYNTKPPLAIWLMAISIKVFGANEFAVRLPSVLAFLGVLFLVFRFSKKIFASYDIGVIACLVLLGSGGLLISHGVRTGDLDSLLVFCTTLLVFKTIALLLYKKEDEINIRKEIIKTGLVLLAGFLIKSTAIFTLLPGLFLCLLFSNNRNIIFKEKALYVVPLALLTLILLYYLLMHYLHPGYSRQVLFSEYERVYRDIMPWHREPAYWYVNNFIRGRFIPFIYFIPPAIILGLISADQLIRKMVLYLLIISSSYLAIISAVPDKLEWYDQPIYPLFALMIGIGVQEMIQRLFRWKQFTEKYKRIWLVAVMVLLLIPIIGLRKKLIQVDPVDDLEREAFCLKQVKKENIAIQQLTLLMPVENPLHRLSADFYRKGLSGRLKIKTVNFVSELNKGDTVLCSQKDKLDSLSTYFKQVDTIYDLKYGKIIVIPTNAQ